ncbi:hypothetical protein PIB30_080839 [Stylosanthes scabra]|uniref:Aminotransferase-like plant mobile domain-containing protein n=1 Tax=Stylosanthes scabra TaxID=79078 RepID=A0ABU6XQ75_9FABA|nr:hypothetical protein [Stylosanthes scabra]
MSTAFFRYKTAARVHLRWLPATTLEDTARVLHLLVCYTGIYAEHLAGTWFMWWSRYLPTSDEKEPRVLQYRRQLDRLTLHEGPLIYFKSIEWHQVDRVIPQFGDVQNTPHRPLNIDFLHSKDGRGIGRWWPHRLLEMGLSSLGFQDLMDQILLPGDGYRPKFDDTQFDVDLNEPVSSPSQSFMALVFEGLGGKDGLKRVLRACILENLEEKKQMASCPSNYSCLGNS